MLQNYLIMILNLLRKVLKKEAKNLPKKEQKNQTLDTIKEIPQSMKISDVGIKLITEFEGLETKPYLDAVKVPTIGYGNTYYEDGTKVTLSDPEITPKRAMELFKLVVVEYEEIVNKLVTVKLNQNQFDALVSFAYNLGGTNLSKSTLLKLLNKGEYNLAAKEFPKWSKAGGKVLAGLVRRRLAEQELFLKPME